MSANPELWKQIIADREQRVLAEIRIRHALAERNGSATQPNRVHRAVTSARAWTGHQLISAGQRLQGLDSSPSLTLAAPQPCGDSAA